MTKKDKEVILKAVKLILTGKEQFSCVAIMTALRLTKTTLNDFAPAHEYSKFYGIDSLGVGSFSLPCTPKGRNERALALLLFAEVGLDGLK